MVSTTVSTRWQCWFCVSSAPVVRLLFLRRFFTHGPLVDFSHHSVFVSLRALELMSAQFLPLIFDVTSFARRVRRLSRDRRCENNNRHHIDSWQRSYGFYVFTKRYDSMEISGEDDQTNSVGARSTGRDLQQEQAGEQEWSAQAPTPADLTEAHEWSVQPSPPMPMQRERQEHNVPDLLWDRWNEDQQRQWLQVQPWDKADPWRRYGIVASRTERPQNHSWDQWNHWNTNDQNKLSSRCARGDDAGWSSRSQWHSEPKKYFDKSPLPEWDGNHPEKTCRDYRRTLKQWLNTTDVPPERHGMLLWRASTGDANLLISHFRDEDLLCWMLGRGYLTSWLRLTSITEI